MSELDKNWRQVQRRRKHSNVQGGVIAKALVQPVLEAVEAFAHVPDLLPGRRYERFQVASAMFILQLYNSGSPHNTKSEYQAVTQKQLRRRFRNNRKFIWCVQYLLVETDHLYDRRNGQCKGYRLDETQRKALDSLFKSFVPPTNGTWHMAHGRRHAFSQ